MKIYVNDKEHIFNENCLTLGGLLEKINMSSTGVVAELNGEVLNNKDFSSKNLSDGSRIELIRIVGGG
jgi:thiamine biosynthesis protein ThiS